MLQSSCSLHSSLGVLRAAPSLLIKRLQSWRATILDNKCSSKLPIPSKMKHEAVHEKAENAPFSIFDWPGSQPRSQGSLPLAAALLRDPWIGRAKEQLSLCRLRRSLATRAELLKIIPNWDPFFRQFPPSGALLHFGSHRYQRGRWSSHPSVLFHYAILRITKNAIFI